jgi:hypothetical protein
VAVPRPGTAGATTEIILVARSIGRPTLDEPLSGEGHLGLVFELEHAGAHGSWIVQAGPIAGLLRGTLVRCTSGWLPAFAVADGAVWDSGARLVLPVSVVLRIATPGTSVAMRHGARLAAIVSAINERRLPYRYETGPNSNTFVRMVLEDIGSPVPVLPSTGGLAVRGWEWEPPMV